MYEQDLVVGKDQQRSKRSAAVVERECGYTDQVGDIVVTGVYGYHAVVNIGANLAIAANFLCDGWVEILPLVPEVEKLCKSDSKE